MVLRSKVEGKLLVKHGSDNLRSTFKNYGIKMWNCTPDIIKDCKTLVSAKKNILDSNGHKGKISKHACKFIKMCNMHFYSILDHFKSFCLRYSE